VWRVNVNILSDFGWTLCWNYQQNQSEEIKSFGYEHKVSKRLESFRGWKWNFLRAEPNNPRVLRLNGLLHLIARQKAFSVIRSDKTSFLNFQTLPINLTSYHQADTSPLKFKFTPTSFVVSTNCGIFRETPHVHLQLHFAIEQHSKFSSPSRFFCQFNDVTFDNCHRRRQLSYLRIVHLWYCDTPELEWWIVRASYVWVPIFTAFRFLSIKHPWPD
jgi:hypothetical protein